nr:hypothetical protein Itr_chr11CG09680 [Ipomoea trifida]
MRRWQCCTNGIKVVVAALGVELQPFATWGRSRSICRMSHVTCLYDEDGGFLAATNGTMDCVQVPIYYGGGYGM